MSTTDRPESGLDRERLPGFLDEPAEVVAEQLLGCFLERTFDGRKATVRIVETEAYDQEDAASHTFRGETRRNAVMFGESGRLYVYFTYGMHYCCNVVCGPAGFGAAALIRAVEPVDGVSLLEARRGITGVNTTNGPAKLCQAMDLDLGFNGHDLGEEPLRLIAGELGIGEVVGRSTRVGITRATDRLRRYYLTGNPYVSRARGAGN